jgi:hypothetical protein
MPVSMQVTCRLVAACPRRTPPPAALAAALPIVAEPDSGPHFALDSEPDSEMAKRWANWPTADPVAPRLLHRSAWTQSKPSKGRSRLRLPPRRLRPVRLQPSTTHVGHPAGAWAEAAPAACPAAQSWRRAVVPLVAAVEAAGALRKRARLASARVLRRQERGRKQQAPAARRREPRCSTRRAWRRPLGNARSDLWPRPAG